MINFYLFYIRKRRLFDLKWTGKWNVKYLLFIKGEDANKRQKIIKKDKDKENEREQNKNRGRYSYVKKKEERNVERGIMSYKRLCKEEREKRR